MLKDINYDLIETISIISKSLYRYDTYMEDASDCKACQDVWRKLKDNRQQELSMLMKELKAHIDTGKLTF